MLRPLFSKFLKRYPLAKDSANYGYLKLLDDACGSCGFLNEARRCQIQERMGAKALSDTCTMYPRMVHHFGDLYQMTLNLSCPVAARLALLGEDAFDFVAQDRTFHQSNITEIEPKSGVSLSVMNEVRTFMFQILRTGELELPTRLKVLGLACERLTNLIQKHKVEAIPELLQTFEVELEQGILVAQLEAFQERPDIRVLISSVFFRSKRMDRLTPHQARILEEVASGLGIRKGALELPILVESYALGLEHLAPALETAPKLLEHYLLNEALRELFPWSETSPIQHFTTLLIRFAILRMLLVGRGAAREEPLTAVELAETAQVFSRLYPHVEDFSKEIQRAFSGVELEGLDKLLALV